MSEFTASNFTTDVVHFRGCKQDMCVVACFSNCDCVDGTGSPCEETTPPPTPPPTMAPAPTDGVPKDCPIKENTDQCATVAVDTNLRAGETCEYCYNFCDGEFWGCCQENGQCSQRPCEGFKVYGCPEIFTGPTTAPTSTPGRSTPTGNGSGAATLGVSSTLAVIVATLIFLARKGY